ncbi:uncharacterized protein LOC131520374 [Onychostoma macrolepis]|uniref:uncharacterized protein LOC131520374 n=1 Tax=Onychostoma macrolepis TaxID=369639 RepID=UPI00272C715E|nr:uncharacterized protein LOC131520374 [Onychostoma macrolepis]
MLSVALRLFIFCLFHPCIQGPQVPVNTEVLAQMIQYFDEKLQPGGNNQYSVLIRVPYQHCTDRFSLDSVFNTNEIKTAFNYFKTNRGRRLYEVTKDSVSLTATKPSLDPTSSSEEDDHAEYILIYSRDDANTPSPLQKILDMINDDQCVVLYTYNSPCITKCINDEDDSILHGLSNWKNTQTTGIKAFVFQKIWPKDSTGLAEDQKEQFTKINDLVPLYRCVKNNNQMQCYKCGTAGSLMLLPDCVS